MIRTYELMVVVRPDFAADDEGKRQEVIEKLVGTDGVSISSISLMGKKRLAYPIQKLSEGIYLLATLASNAIKSADIEKRSSLSTDVIRYLLLAKK